MIEAVKKRQQVGGRGKEEQVVRAQVTAVYEQLVKSKVRVVALKGGAGSSKSYSIAQWVVKVLIEQEKVKIGIMRKTFPALRRTAYELVVGLLKEYGIYELCEHDKTNHVIRYRGRVIDFLALDDPEKIKSADFNYIWAEEATEFSYEDFLQMDLRLRAPAIEGKTNQIVLSFNPVDASSWIATKLVMRDDVELLHSTYRDNPFLSAEYIKALEALVEQDENYYRVYTLGEWGRLENLIITKYSQVTEFPKECRQWFYGLDFGYTQPTALIKVGQDEKGKLYVDEKVYQSKLTNADLIALLGHEERGDIYADSAEPARIEEISRAGYAVSAANKDVKFGLDLLTRQELHITSSSANLLKEISGYRRQKDKDGNIREDPVKFHDHACDAMRYAIAGLVERYGSAVAQVSSNRYRAFPTLTFSNSLTSGGRIYT